MGRPAAHRRDDWLEPADRYRGRCEHINGAHVLKLEPIDGARHLSATPTAGWGLHLVDVNGALGELETTVARQSAVTGADDRARSSRRRPRIPDPPSQFPSSAARPSCCCRRVSLSVAPPPAGYLAGALAWWPTIPANALARYLLLHRLP